MIVEYIRYQIPEDKARSFEAPTAARPRRSRHRRTANATRSRAVAKT